MQIPRIHGPDMPTDGGRTPRAGTGFTASTPPAGAVSDFNLSQIDTSRLIFVGGLHRSGTTALGKILADHPNVSGFRETGVEEDEGQHLQSVYKPAWDYGGPGRFALHRQAHLTERSTPPPRTAVAGLLDAWVPFWDLDRHFLVEKSPPNLIMGRYLQEAFPGSALVVIIRHPVVVALATRKWTRGKGLAGLMKHWFAAHDILRSDSARLKRLHVLRYEDLINRPARALDDLQSHLGLGEPLSSSSIDGSRSQRYVRAWDELARGTARGRWAREKIRALYGDRIAAYGYDVQDLEALGPWEW